MALKQETSRKIKIGAASAMCVFSVLVTVTGVLAWFSTNKGVNADHGSFNIAKVDSAVTAITVHDFYGLTADGSEFGFNPTPNHTIDLTNESGSDSGTFAMGGYSLTDPHHPVLFLFAVDGTNEVIKLKTESPYLAQAIPTEDYEVATYSALSTYEDGAIVKVTADENNYSTTTYYQYHASDSSFELTWLDLKQEHNPLSSIVVSYYLLFEDDPTDNTGTHQTKTGELMIPNGFGGGSTAQTKTYTPVAASDLNNTNSSSFVSFDANGNPVFNRTANLYQGSTSGYTHLGIVIDYLPASLEYIYSFYLGHVFLNAGLGFDCDWSMEI